jgi:hypothetical protein
VPIIVAVILIVSIAEAVLLVGTIHQAMQDEESIGGLIEPVRAGCWRCALLYYRDIDSVLHG